MRPTDSVFELKAGPAYAEAFLSVLRNVTKEDTVQYVLALLDDMLTGMCGRALQAVSRPLNPMQAAVLVPVEDSASAKLFHEQSSMHEKRTESYSILLRYCSSILYVTVVGAQGLSFGEVETAL